MSKTDQFWQYAKEAVLSASYAKTDEERQGLLDLGRTWTQAALLERDSSIDRDKPAEWLPGKLEYRCSSANSGAISGMSVGPAVASVAGRSSLPYQQRG